MRFATLFAVVLLVAATTGAADLVTRNYDVRPLMITIPDFTDAPDFRDQLAAPSTRPAPSAEKTRQQISGDLQASTRMMLAGIEGATVSEADGNLRVTAPADRHERIKQSIDAAIERMRRQVNLTLRMVQVPTAVLQKLDPTLQKSVDRVLLDRRATVTLSEAEQTSLMRATQSSTDASVLTAPRVTLFNGQRAYVLVATQRAFVKGFTPSKTDPKKYDPDVDVYESGIVVDCRAEAGEDSVALSLRVQVAQLLDLKEQPWAGSPADQKLTVQVPSERILELDRLLSVPDKQWTLLHIPATDPAAADPKMAYLVLVQATSVTQNPTPADRPLK